MKRAFFAVVFAVLLVVGVTVALAGGNKAFPSTGRVDNLKWGASEASVRADLAKRKVVVGDSVEIHPGGRNGVRFQETTPRPVFGPITSDLGVLYAFIDDHLAVVTVGFTTSVQATPEIIKALKETYELVDANSPNDSLVIVDFRSDSGHVIVFMALDEERKAVNYQMVFMAEQEYNQTIQKKRDAVKKIQPPTQTELGGIKLGL